MSRKILFVDRDGTLIVEPADEQIDQLAKVALLPQVVPSLLTLINCGYELVMVTNQDGLGSVGYPQERYDEVQRFIIDLFASQGITFKEVLLCPHRPSDGCRCRKPQLGMLLQYLADPSWDRQRSAVIGDRLTDLELAQNMGILGLRVGPAGESWPQIVALLRLQQRRAVVTRQTNETNISVKVDLDALAPCQISTKLGFFDHMLEQLARHGAFALELAATGDLHVDEHHTIEDCALTLGAALRQALGSKHGIGRYGFYLPMDEATAQVTLDLSGRPYFVFDGNFSAPSVAGINTQMFVHFFRSLTQELGATLHLKLLSGADTHHEVEALFKVVGRALRMAKTLPTTSELMLDQQQLPSTKGVL
jgi:imidazoleglycerol-phosphate dehydratase/histidinol-phosphatase